ncbi:MAG: protein phosphatase CheZ [Hyphomonadaceae bacterium]
MSAATSDERRTLRLYVRAARRAMADLRPTELRTEKLPSAMSEIGLIVETTESAANTIMAAVDDIMGLPAAGAIADYREAVHAKCLAVLEACAFQDLTGQRITKVVAILLTLEDKLAALSALLDAEDEAPSPAPSAGAALLQGPVAPGEGVDQDAIDRLFADLA